MVMAALCLLLTSCDENCINGNGPIVSEDLYLNDINSFAFYGSGNVYVSYGNEQRVRIEANRDIISRLNRQVNGGHWDIYFDECVRNSSGIRVFLTVKDLSYIGLLGSGKIEANQTLQTDVLNVSLSGSGDIFLNAQCQEVFTNLTGSGRVQIYGSSEFSQLSISGSGRYLGQGLNVDNARVNITGSGDAEMNVSDELDVTISGSGNVYYIGNPTLKVNITGSGKVIPF